MRKFSLVFGVLVAATAAIILLRAQGEGTLSPPKEELLWRYRNLGKALFETPTSVAQSVVELKKARDLNPNSYRDQLNYGLALLRSGNLKEAIPELEKAQKLDPKLPYTWFNLGIAYKRDAQYPQAIAQFEHMIQLVPDEPVSHYNLGLLYNLTNREQDAIKQFQIAASLDANLVAPRFQLYNVYRLAGNDAEAAKSLAEFMDAKKRQKAADDSEDMEWCYYAELYDPIQATDAIPPPPAPELKFGDRKLHGEIDPKTAGLLVIDSTGGGSSDLLAWSSDGIRLYRQAKELVQTIDIKGVISVAADDVDNDTLADLCVLTSDGATLYRNAKGRFEKAQTLASGRFDAAVWVDFDHDYDLDLLLLGAKSELLRNEEGTFRDYSEHFPFAPGHAIAAVAFRVVPDSKSIDLAVSYADHAGVLYRDQMRGLFKASPLDAVPAGARSLAAADVDNDSWIDLAFNGPDGIALALNHEGKFEPLKVAGPGAFVFTDLDNRGIQDLVSAGSVYRNLGRDKFEAGQSILAAAAWASADFNQDGRADLAAAAPDGSLRVLHNETSAKNEWLRVSITGIKNLMLGTGAEVEIKAGNRYQKKIYEGVPLLFGLGSTKDVDAVRISWPNGLIQNQMNQPAARAVAYKEAPRLSGSCPMVFAFNGREFQFISDVLGVAPLGASSGDGSFFPVDNDEYLQLPEGSLAPVNGRYELSITEELHEVTYLDQAHLIAVDHPDDVEIFTNDKFKSPPFPEFRLFGVRRRIYPRAGHDSHGRDVLERVLHRDRVYDGGFKHDLSGRAEMHWLDLDFGPRAAIANRAVLVLNGWIDWADGSVFMAASQGGSPGLVMPYLQVKDTAGRWRTVIEDMGVPSGGPKTIVVDLTGKFLSTSREVRIVTNTCLYWDQVFLSEDTTPPTVQMTSIDPVAASLDLRGFSRVVLDPHREQPEAYRYADWEPEAMWNPVPGLYTRYGDVTDLVRETDDRMVIMGSGDELRLSFDARELPPLRPGFKRDFLFLADGWSKDADANTAFSQSVEPLPFHGMSQYPYPSTEHFPDDPVHRAWRAQYNTRRSFNLMPSLAHAEQKRN